jgi:hypothetical protein
MFTKPFLKDMVERAIKTIAQTMVAMLTAGATGLLDVDYVNVLSVAGLAGVVSILTSIGSSTVGNTNSASLVVETKGEK